MSENGKRFSIGWKILLPLAMLIAIFALVFIVSLIKPNANAYEIGQNAGVLVIFAFIGGWYLDSKAKSKSGQDN